MSFRFRRRIRILPGLWLNASKSGLSTSVGKRGANVTVGHGQTRTTVGAPGTGLSYTTTTGRKRTPQQTRPLNVIVGMIFFAGLVWAAIAWLL